MYLVFRNWNIYIIYLINHDIYLGSIDKSPNSTQNTLRENEIRKRQSTPVQLYDPWGKPGAGAPISTSDGSIRTHRNVVRFIIILYILYFKSNHIVFIELVKEEQQ